MAETNGDPNHNWKPILQAAWFPKERIKKSHSEKKSRVGNENTSVPGGGNEAIHYDHELSRTSPGDKKSDDFFESSKSVVGCYKMGTKTML